MSGDIFCNGMNWFRVDFHLHTKAEGVSIGVITNHNKFDREEYKSLRKVAGRKDIWLLPGVELSVNDGVIDSFAIRLANE